MYKHYSSAFIWDHNIRHKLVVTEWLWKLEVWKEKAWFDVNICQERVCLYKRNDQTYINHQLSSMPQFNFWSSATTIHHISCCCSHSTSAQHFIIGAIFAIRHSYGHPLPFLSPPQSAGRAAGVEGVCITEIIFKEGRASGCQNPHVKSP